MIFFYTWGMSFILYEELKLTWQVVVSVTPQTILCIPSTQTFSSINFYKFTRSTLFMFI